MNKFIVITFLSIIITSCHSNANIKSISNSNLNLTSPAYFEKWIAGVEGGGSGFNVFLPIKKSSFINFDSIHFRGQRVKALHRNNMVFGRFKSINNNHSEDIIIENSKLGKHIVLVPIAFVSEHSETLVELDIEYKELADKNGCKNYSRVSALGTNENYIKAM